MPIVQTDQRLFKGTTAEILAFVPQSFTGWTYAESTTDNTAYRWNSTTATWEQIGGTTGLSPFYFRLDPTSTAQLGAGRGVAAAPVVTAATDARGRPVIRIAFTNGVGEFSIVPLLSAPATPLSLQGDFLIEMRANFFGPTLGIPDACSAGIMFNLDQTSASGIQPIGARNYKGFGVEKKIATPNSIDTSLSFAEQNITAFSMGNAVADMEQPGFWVRAWMNVTGNTTTFSYAASSGADDWQNNTMKQQENLALQLAAAPNTGVGIQCQNANGTLDIGVLNIWKPAYLW